MGKKWKMGKNKEKKWGKVGKLVEKSKLVKKKWENGEKQGNGGN